MKDCLLGNSSAASDNPVEVSDEAGLEKLFRTAQAHLEAHPEDGTLMIADYESFSRDLGFVFSSTMLAHVRKAVRRSPADSPKAKAAYDKLKAVGPDDTFQLAAHLQLDSEQDREVALWQPKDLQLPKDAAVRPEDSAGFGVLLQVSEAFCNEVLVLMFSKSAFRSRWTGSLSSQIADLSVNLVADYDVRLKAPNLEFLQSNKPDEAAMVRLSLDATAKVALTAEFMPLSGASLPVERERFEVDLSLAITIETALDISPPNAGGESAVAIDLRNIRDLKVTINGQDIDPPLMAFLKEALNRIVRKEIEYEKQIPISHAFSSREYGGQRLRSIGLRTLLADTDQTASLSIGLDFDGAGNESAIRPIIPRNESYAFIVRKEVFDAIWNAQKDKIKSTDSDVKLSSPRLVLMDGYLAFSINAKYKVFDIGNCGWVSWWVHASARAGFAFESFQKDGIYFVRPRLTSGPDIDLDKWDQFLLAFLVGFLLTIIGISWGAGSVLALIAIEAIIGKVEEGAANQLQGYSVGLRGDLPGTSVMALSNTPTAPVIFRAGITAHGGITFKPK